MGTPYSCIITHLTLLNFVARGFAAWSRSLNRWCALSLQTEPAPCLLHLNDELVAHDGQKRLLADHGLLIVLRGNPEKARQRKGCPQ
jgi:hypothetical protein